MDVFAVVPARAGARGFMCPTHGGNGGCLMIFAWRRACASAIRGADIAGLRGILCDVVARIFGRVGGDCIQLISLLRVDLLDRARFRAAEQQRDAANGRAAQPVSHLIPHMNRRPLNARAAFWGAA